MSQHTPRTSEELAALRAEISPLTEGFDLIGDHVIITDADGTILYANKAAEEHTGFSVEEMIGENPGELWGGIMDKEFFEQMWRTIKIEKQPFVADIQNRNKEGELYWQELKIFPVLGENGEPRFFIGIEPDATARKVFAAHTQQYIEELERLNTYMQGRELKIGELTKEVASLKERLQELNSKK